MDLEKLNAGDNHYKAYVGPPLKYDLVGAMQFNLLTSFGLRDFHKLLDIGCGSLRSGKLMIPFLRAGNYYGLEPNKWLIDDGVKYELGEEIISIKSPKFLYNANFDLQAFNQKFDFLIAQSIFSHASSEQIKACFKEAQMVMNPESLFLATFVLGKENYEGSEWVYPGCVTYTHKYITALARSQKLEAIKTKWFHPNGQTWYVLCHPENKKKAEELNRKLFLINKQDDSLLENATIQKMWTHRFTQKVLRKLKLVP